ncbi:MAG: cell envelope integrity protein TolA [Bdellovibrio sp.]|nr:cell envelope integrity protein TolA [Bdellovibrio sp.]
MVVPPFRAPQVLTTSNNFKVAVKWSLLCHVALFTMLWFRGFSFPSKIVPFVPTLKVDLVGLPDYLKKDLAINKPSQELSRALEKAEEAAKQLKNTQYRKAKTIERSDNMVLKPKATNPVKNRQSKMKNALSRIKALEKVSPESNETQVVLKGNILSKGSSISQDAKENIEGSYYDSLKDHLQQNWALPVWLSRQDLSAQVQIHIDQKGYLRHFQFVKVSNNQTFDEMVIKTLQSSQPYPIPPREIAKELLLNGVLLGFPL